jgi:hypothetical protein
MVMFPVRSICVGQLALHTITQRLLVPATDLESGSDIIMSQVTSLPMMLHSKTADHIPFFCRLHPFIVGARNMRVKSDIICAND